MLPRHLSLCLLTRPRLLLGALQEPTHIFHSITANIICSIVFGKRFAYKDPEFLKLLDMFYQTFALISSFSSQVRERVRKSGEKVDIQGRGKGVICFGGPEMQLRVGRGTGQQRVTEAQTAGGRERWRDRG